MRQLSSNSDLSDIPEPLREEVAACLQRWRTSGVPVEPETELVALLELGDSVDAIAAILGDAADEDYEPPAEWVADHGCVYEVFVCWNDDGQGISILVPKTAGTNAGLLEFCAGHAT
jgi:hypothetical protein